MKTLSLLLLIIALVPITSFAQEKSNGNYLRLAEQGDAVAQNELGVRIAEGIGTKSNNKVAVEWFRKSAEQGNALGACNLGLHYARGAGIRRNLVLAFMWFYVANSLDSLKCHPSDYFELFKPSRAQDKRAWENAVAWLRAHPELKDDFGQRPWLNDKPQ
jgi:hypothetical protein